MAPKGQLLDGPTHQRNSRNKSRAAENPEMLMSRDELQSNVLCFQQVIETIFEVLSF